MITQKHIIIIVFAILSTFIQAQNNWRSKLYPENWTPGMTDSEGRFLHDFSYAGYHSGLESIPFRTKNVINITKKPYMADNTATKDVTEIVQKAIDDASKVGGGVIYFPKGEYLFSVSMDKDEAIRISSNNIIIRGEGADKTFFKNSSTFMRLKKFIRFEPNGGNWISPVELPQPITEDLLLPTSHIPVRDASVFKKGDLVVVMTDCTPEFVKEHKSEEMWAPYKIAGVRFCRNVVKVDKITNSIEIDVPTRYFLKLRDNARVFRIGNQLQECGIENLSIGNIQNPKESLDLWLRDNADQDKPNTGYYDVHGSVALLFRHAMNCWARNVSTYRPKENSWDFHLLSNGIDMKESRFITIEKCNFQRSQYEGGGGNGYMYVLEGNDCLLTGCIAEHGRHNYDFKMMCSSGNVIYNCSGKDPMYSTDYHMWLSMSNLIDSFTSDGDVLEAFFRPWGGDKDVVHSYSTTQSVYWNIIGKKIHPRYDYLIKSIQYGWGYVIGTSGEMSKVVTTPIIGKANGGKVIWDYDTTPQDWVEGEGKGNTLQPKSLYKDQLEKRKLRLKISNE